MADNAAMTFPGSLLSASANLPNHLFKGPLPFGGEPLVPPPPTPPKTPVIERKVVEIVIERAVIIENMVILCLPNKVRILSAKDIF